MSYWSETDFFDDADEALKDFFTDSNHTGDVDTMSTFLTANDLTIITGRPGDLPVDGVSRPLAYITTKEAVPTPDETTGETIDVTTEITIFTQGHSTVNEGYGADPRYAVKTGQQIAGTMASMLSQLFYNGSGRTISTWESSYCNNAAKPEVTMTLETDDDQNDLKADSVWKLEVVWQHCTVGA